MRRFFSLLLLAGALTITPVIAQESGKSAESSESGEKPGMEIWKWINFAILAVLLGRMIAKNAGPMLAARSRGIQEGLAAGEKAKAEADARAAQVSAKLSGLGAAVAEMRAEAQIEREREAGRIRRETDLELARIQQYMAQEIESAGKVARREAQRHAARLALDLAEQKVRARMSHGVQENLLANFISSVSSAANGKSAHLAG